jgi:hypothetical protein
VAAVAAAVAAAAGAVAAAPLDVSRKVGCMFPHGVPIATWLLSCCACCGLDCRAPLASCDTTNWLLLSVSISRSMLVCKQFFHTLSHHVTQPQIPSQTPTKPCFHLTCPRHIICCFECNSSQRMHVVNVVHISLPSRHCCYGLITLQQCPGNVEAGLGTHSKTRKQQQQQQQQQQCACPSAEKNTCSATCWQ